MTSKESPENNPGLVTSPDAATSGFFVQQANYRIKDPKATLDFYSRVLGMSLLKRLDFETQKFSLYMLGYTDIASAPTDPVDRAVWTFSQKATLELVHVWGTETDPDFAGYSNGNTEPLGFGHIGICVADLQVASARFETLGVQFQQKPVDGNPAFILDPDGYWVEVFDLAFVANVAAVAG
ncbi:hypothetical protein ACP275_04G207100 [Erythranthe tilingii]